MKKLRSISSEDLTENIKSKMKDINEDLPILTDGTKIYYNIRPISCNLVEPEVEQEIEFKCNYKALQSSLYASELEIDQKNILEDIRNKIKEIADNSLYKMISNPNVDLEIYKSNVIKLLRDMYSNYRCGYINEMPTEIKHLIEGRNIDIIVDCGAGKVVTAAINIHDIDDNYTPIIPISLTKKLSLVEFLSLNKECMIGNTIDFSYNGIKTTILVTEQPIYDKENGYIEINGVTENGNKAAYKLYY